MVKLAAGFVLACCLGSAQTPVESTCRLAGGVHIPPGENSPKCVVGQESGTSDPPQWIYSGIEFPHVTGDDKSCMILTDVFLPYNWVAAWTPNLQMLFARTSGISSSDDINFTVRATIMGGDFGLDIRSPLWGAPKSNDDTPNNPPPQGATLYEPYITTIHDIPFATDTKHVLAVRRNVPMMVCREDGPNAGEEDANEGAVLVVNVLVRWEDAANVVQATQVISLASTSQEVPFFLPTNRPANSVLAGLEESWGVGQAYTDDPQDISIAQTTGVCTADGAGEWPACDFTKTIEGIDLHDGKTECMVAQVEYPGSTLLSSGVPLDIMFKPRGEEGTFLFGVSTAFREVGEDLSIPAVYGTEIRAEAPAICTNGYARARIEAMNMAGAAEGKTMLLRVCRIGGAVEDTAISTSTLLKLRIYWKRLIKIEGI